MSGAGELDLNLPEPEVSPAEVEQLVAILFAAADELGDDGEPLNGWLTAKKIAARIGEGSTDRRVRKIASAAAPAVVSFPGSRGYKLWQLCSVEEINHCIEAFESQGRDMLKRSVLYRRAYHKRFRGLAQPIQPDTTQLNSLCS